MPFQKKIASEKKFGARDTRTISVVVPVDEYETIKIVVKEYVDNYSQNNCKRIISVKDSIEEIISMYLDVGDYIWKQKSIDLEKYYSILFNHNSDLLKKIIEEYPIERKKPVKTLIEEKIEKESRKEESLKISPELNVIPLTPHYRAPPINKYPIGTFEYNREIDKRMKKARKRRK